MINIKTFGWILIGTVLVVATATQSGATPTTAQLDLERILAAPHARARQQVDAVTLLSTGGGTCGNGSPDPGEECDDGNTVSGDGCSSTCQLDNGSEYDCTQAIPGTPDVNLVTDGSFEMRNLNDDWTIIDHTIFGSIICGDGCSSPLASDEDGNIVSGNFVLVAGGSFTTASTGVVEHAPIQIPPEATTLLFNWGIGTPGDTCAGPSDGMRLLIDGIQVWSNLDDTGQCELVSVYTVIEIPLDGFNDDGMHTIRFEGTASVVPTGDDLTNVFLDQIRIYVTPEDAEPPVPSVCTLVVCGDGQQPQFSASGTEACDDGNVSDGDGCSSTCDVEQPNFVCANTVLAADTGNDVPDGGLEDAVVLSQWVQTGSVFNPICSQALCGAALANSGAFYLWFGGSSVPHVQSLTQDVVISSTSTSLDFDLLIGVCDSPNDHVSIEIDGTQIYARPCVDDVPTYTTQSVPLGAFSDGNMHTISFSGSTVATNGSNSNFFIDDIRINNNLPFAGLPSQCTELDEASATPEQFEAGIPGDWTVVNAGPNGADGWGISNDGICASQNWLANVVGNNVTGGGGLAACADSDATGQADVDAGGSPLEMDTYLCTPAYDLSAVTQPALSFLVDYQSADNTPNDNGTPNDLTDDFDDDFLNVLIGTAAPTPQTLGDYDSLGDVLDHLDTTLALSESAPMSFDLSGYDAQSAAHVCFHYRATYGWFAQIDNVALRTRPLDSDGDGVFDDEDNCILSNNPSQLDTDEDGFGNMCDADFNNDCIVNVTDLGIFRTLFFQPDTQADLNGDGVVAVVDLGILRTLFFGTPGPSANGSCAP